MPVAPNMDSGFVVLTNALVDIPGTTAATNYPAGVHIQNPITAIGPVTAEVKDVNGNTIIPDTPIQPGGFITVDLLTMPIAGKPQWKGLGLVAKFWGWTSWPF